MEKSVYREEPKFFNFFFALNEYQNYIHLPGAFINRTEKELDSAKSFHPLTSL